MKRLIINADDLGYCEAVNYGIIEAYRQGVVSSTTIMANMPGFEHAVEILQHYSEIGLGIHLTCTCDKPLGSNYHTLTDEQGYFYKEDLERFDQNEVFEEWCLQMDRCISAGLVIDHIDSHHHVHNNPIFASAFSRFLKKYPLPIRNGLQYELAVEKDAVLFGKFYKYNCTEPFLEAFFASIEEGKVYDVMCHPAYMDTFLSNSTSYATGRLTEYDVLTSKKIKQAIHDHQIQLITYREL